MAASTLVIHHIFSALKPFWWLLPILMAAAALKSRIFKGWLGESLVKIRINLHLDAQKYPAFHNLMMPSAGATTQIDHVLVSEYGIFVIETKHYSGWIFGHANQAQWTRIRYQQKHRFQNPLRQNYRHIKALARMLNLPDSYFHSIVVFSGDYEFKTPMPENVLDIKQLEQYILKQHQPLLSPAQLHAASKILGQPEYRNTHQKQHAHIAQLKRRHWPH